MTKSMVKWQGCVGKGWEPIVAETIEDIESKGGFITQVKEKFGGLRIYTYGGDREAVDDVIRLAEKKASLTCEECGNYGIGHLRIIRGWYKTLCETCMEEMEKK